MRQGIHPDYVESKVHCSCGNTFMTRSTKPELHIELCNQCHPFYTGQQKFVDTGGRVQRFSDKFGGAADTVMAKAIAEKRARQQAHEESVAALAAVRAAKESSKVGRAAKREVAEAGAAASALDETPEAVIEEPTADVVEEPVAEEAAEAVVEEPVADVVEEAVAEENTESAE
jgi:large subunit ribosomal protein L31